MNAVTDDENRSRRVVAASNVRGASTGNELVLLHLERGVYFTLNETGAWIWEQLEREPALLDLRDGLTARFDVGSDAAWSDLVHLLGELEAEGLVELIADESPPSPKPVAAPPR